MASHYKRVRVPLQDCSGHGLRRPSAHDEMDSPHYGSPASRVATECLCRVVVTLSDGDHHAGWLFPQPTVFLLTPHHNHIPIPARMTNGTISRLPSGPVVPPLHSGLPKACEASR